MKKKIKPAEVTDVQQRVKWAAFFRNPSKQLDLKRAMTEEFNEDEFKKILSGTMVPKAAYVDDEALIWDHFINVRVNLALPKKIILAEVGNLLDRYQKKYNFNTKKRINLSDTNEIYQVWDLYSQAEKTPAKLTFKNIASMTKRPLSTVKDQWRKAYEQIYGEKYHPDSKYVTEETQASAEELCASCPHNGKCYKGGDWSPCSDYLKIAHKEKKELFVEYDDNILYEKP